MLFVSLLRLACLALLCTCVPAAAAPLTAVATAPFAPAGEAEPWVGSALADALALRVHNQPGLGALTLRQPAAALRQVNLEPVALADTGAAVRLGKQLGADFVVTGECATRGQAIAITVRVVDVETEQLIAWQRCCRRRSSSSWVGS